MRDLRMLDALAALNTSDYLSAGHHEQLARLIAVLVIHQRDGDSRTCRECGKTTPCPTTNALLMAQAHR